MAARLTDEFLRWTLDVDGKPAMAALNSMEQSTKKLQNTNRLLSTEMAKLEAQGKKNTAEYAALNRQFITNNQTIAQATARMAQLRGEIGLSSLTASQLRQRMNELRRSMDQATPNSAAWTAHQRDLTAVTNRYNQVRSAATRTHAIFGQLQGILPVIGFAAVAAGVKSLVSNMISVRSEFEKYEAVLTNTLGSNKKARMELGMLQQFAVETPFALTELTGAFVKLTNYGLKPSREEMRQYGDLASSVGKGFDQLAEGLADAVTGEFERLKEFGIKAKKEGDKITFTFKEQATVVDNNAASIKKYITGLGDLQGVAGSMAAISATLGGKINNLGDAWDGLMNVFGAGTSGIMTTVIQWMTDFINMNALAFKSIKALKAEVMDKAVTEGMTNALGEIDVMTNSLVKKGVNQADAHKRAIMLYNQSISDSIVSTQAKLAGATEEEKVQLNKRIYLLTEEQKAVADHYVELAKAKKLQDDAKNKKPTEKEENKAEKKALVAAEAANKMQVDLINKNHLEGKTSEDQYNADLLRQEFIFLQAKMSIYKKGSKEYEDAASAFSDKQVKSQEQVKTLLLQAEKELSDAKIANLKDGIDKEKVIEDQRWKEELALLKEKLIVKESLSKEEIAINDAINNTITEKTAAHVKTTTGLAIAGEQQKVMDKALIDDAKAQSDEEKWKAQTEIAQATYQEELTAANGNGVAIAKAERKLSDSTIQIKKDELNKREEIGNAVFAAANSAFGALSEIVGKETALGKALFLMQQAAAIGQIIFSTAIANAAAVAAFPLTLGMPWVAINTVSAGISIASVLAQSLAGGGKQSGGYADGAPSDSKPVGIYHANEFIASGPAVRNPTVKPILDIIDIAQRTGTIKNLNLADIMGQAQKQSGGYASSNNPSISSNKGSSNLEIVLTKISAQLDKPITANVAAYGGKGSVADSIKQIANLAKSLGI